MNLRNALLAGLLCLACGPGTVMRAAAETLAPAPAWVIDPSTPGANLPPLGRSLFDQLFAVEHKGERGAASIELPFPFDALLARLDAQLARDPTSHLPPAKRVLIPLGRSLQRTAAAPDYFAFPRVVVAADAHPASTAAPFLKDRLYIAYQEKSAVLEVISYNEAAGRFEFQLVKDYRAGGRPKVFYADRNLCFACHQNGAPIFSRALWDETNANPKVAALLAATGKRFYGIRAERGVDVPYAIDSAIKRANGFALTQRLWRQGCGDSDAAARRCRAGLFAAALRHALSGGQAWTPDADFSQTVSARLLPEARRRWPGGLAIGNQELPNRNPVHDLAGWPADRAQRVAHSHVPARFEPLAPRAPREIWQADAAGALGTLVAGLAEFVSAAELRHLETILARQVEIATVRLQARCRISASVPASRWSVHCSPGPGQLGPTLTGTLSLAAGRPTGGQLTRLTLPGGTALSSVELTARDMHASFTPRVDGRLARSADGHAITRVVFSRNRSDPTAGEVALDIRQEFAAIEQAMSALAEGSRGEILFGPGVLPRESLLATLFAQLGATALPACCRAARTLPAPRLETPEASPGDPTTAALAPTLQNFYPYCATCHQSAETFPPNFLSGSSVQVAERLRQCAPRLYVRLSMAELTPEQREKTPMPPESMLPAFGINSAGWRASPLRAALLGQVGDWLRAETGQAASLDQLLADGYEALRPCLPAP